MAANPTADDVALIKGFGKGAADRSQLNGLENPGWLGGHGRRQVTPSRKRARAWLRVTDHVPRKHVHMLLPDARRFDPQLLLEPDAVHETQHPYQ